MPVPEFLQPWLGSGDVAAVLLYGGLALLVLLLLAGLWLLLGRGPQRRRAYQRARRLLQRGAWQEALDIIHTLQQRRLSPMWQGRLSNLEGECHHRAGDLALEEGRYEEGRQHYQRAAQLLSVDAAELHQRVIATMLAEVRGRFAAVRSPADADAVLLLTDRVLLLEPRCPEASFWQGLCHVRAGRLEKALESLAAAHQDGKAALDPPLYLGALLLRAGRAQEALRCLAEANRIDPHCPLVTWQLGMAIVAAGGDCGLAVRALQKATGPRGLGLWTGKPERLWIEAFPESRSFVRRLASAQPFACPVFGGDSAAMIREGVQVLAQAHYRLGNFQESADLWAKLLQEVPPTVPLLRGLGLALARLEKYDQAYKYLRLALDQEEPKTPFTAGYLALCGALGKPTQPADKQKNVAWAIRLLSKFDLPSDAEWARLNSMVFAEARQIGLPVAAEDQQRLCEVLLSVRATDPAAAAAYAHLMGTHPEAVRPEYAWLYARAAQEHGCTSEHDLKLFGLLFHEEPAARAFYERQGWDFDEVQYAYLARCAALRPGGFPPELGPDYPSRGEALLLARSRKLEEAGQAEAALASAEALLALAPQSGPAHDRLAQLHYRRGNLDRAAALLAGWHRLEPSNPWPLLRQAVVEQQRGNRPGRDETIAHALQHTRGKRRAEVAFLAARLALADGEDAHLRSAGDFLQECLKDNPDHTDALWCLAAVRAVAGDRAGLAAQAAAMDRPQVTDPRFHYLAAVCHLAARDDERVIEAAQRTIALVAAENGDAQSPAARLVAESEYLIGLAHLHQQDAAAAAKALQKPALAPHSYSSDHARALLGRLGFARGDYDDAVKWWSALDAARRHEWKFDEPLRATVFLAGLLAYQAGDFEGAAEKFRAAGRLGLRERRLGALLALAYFKAGQRLLYRE